MYLTSMFDGATGEESLLEIELFSSRYIGVEPIVVVAEVIWPTLTPS